jgi:small subunit ribosomal protein S9
MAEKKAAAPAKGPKTFYIGTGRRKTAVARVRVTEGKGQILINGRPLDDFFSEEKDRAAVLGPLKVTDQLGRLDVLIQATGGGITGQAGACSQGVARAIKTMFSPPDEQKRHVFNQTTVVKAYRDEKKARERAKAPTPPPAPKVIPTAPPGPKIVTLPVPGAPKPEAPPVDPADVPTGMIKKLRDSGYLTRDARMKERKKYGLRGARRGTQFSKR